MTLQRLPKDSPVSQVKAFLEEHGYAVIEGLRPAALMDRLVADIAPYASRTPICAGEFFGGALRMFTGIIPKSAAYVELLDTPLVTEIAEAILGEHPLLNATAMYILEKGGRGQTLHQDETTYTCFMKRSRTDPQIMINMMWAAVDFTRENGATRMIPGSHRWPEGRVPGPDDEVIALEMPKGSLAVWLASTFHGGGINHTEPSRIGAEMGFNVGWLRPYEAELLIVPPILARDLPERVRTLLGYRAFRGILGVVDRVSPDEALGWVPIAVNDPVQNGLTPNAVESAVRHFLAGKQMAPPGDVQAALVRLSDANEEVRRASSQAIREILEVTTTARSRELQAVLHKQQLLDQVLAAAGTVER